MTSIDLYVSIYGKAIKKFFRRQSGKKIKERSFFFVPLTEHEKEVRRIEEETGELAEGWNGD